jgi:hypothetical protein
MPRNNRRRRNPGDRVASRPRYGSGSKSDSSSEEFSHPVSHRITTPRNPVTYNLPSNDVSEEESSGGWSSNADFSGHCDEDMIVREVTQQIETIQEQAETVEDGLLLVSDDENDMVEEDDEDYLSADSALRVHRGPTFVTEPPINSYEMFDGTNLETMDAALGKPEYPSIPLSVAIMDQRMDQFDTSEPSMDDSSGKNYDSRYDGSLHDLTQGLHLSYSSHGNEADENDDDSSSSIDEMKGYLSTGDLRCPNIFLKPNVGERPPTPPSPNRKSAPKSKVSGPSMARIPSQEDENGTPEQSIVLLEIQEESSEITWTPPSNINSSIPPVEHSKPAPKAAGREIEYAPYHDPQGTYQSWERPERALPQNFGDQGNSDFHGDHEADYCQEVHDPENYFAYDAPPSVYPTHSLPDGSGVMTSSHADELSDAMRMLVENQTKSRRMVSMLIVALICALVALAAVAGGVVALLFSGGDESASSPLAPPPQASPVAPTPIATAPSPMVAVSVREPSASPKATSLAPILPAPFAAVTVAPVAAPIPTPVALPPIFNVAPTKPPTPKPSLRPTTAAPIVAINIPVTSAPVFGGTVPSTPAPVSFGGLPSASSPTASTTSPPVPNTAIPTSASIKIP